MPNLLGRLLTPTPTPVIEATPPPPEPIVRSEAIQQALADLLEERRSKFTMQDALRLAPVIRSLQLIQGIGSQFPMVAYADGAALEQQPAILTDPARDGMYGDWLATILYALATEGWCPLRLEYDSQTSEYPRSARVLPLEEVDVQWDGRRLSPLYSWRGLPISKRDLRIVRINPRPGELPNAAHGPLREGLDALAPVAAAEEYAQMFFASGGIPSTVIKVAQALLDDQAAAIKQRYIESRDGGPEVVVLGNSADISFPQARPDEMQMAESRAYGATIAARIFGIPAPLLHVETSGSTIVYQNAHMAVDAFAKTTLVPTYLSPIERVMRTLVPPAITVRFELSEMQRADIAARIAMYAQAIATTDAGGASLMTVQEARQLEGWGAGPYAESGSSDRPTQE